MRLQRRCRQPCPDRNGLGEMTSGLRARIDGLELHAGFTVLGQEKA
ncbi:hypothetical protein [Streptomyces sp. f51]|nr:hypothetical protein [Streptomyces sp. f51]